MAKHYKVTRNDKTKSQESYYLFIRRVVFSVKFDKNVLHFIPGKAQSLHVISLNKGVISNHIPFITGRVIPGNPQCGHSKI